jgi:hypothetical protein
MTMTLKTALLATAALATFSTAVQAEALLDLKSLMENLKIRDAVSQASVLVPNGYRIKPTADAAPADGAAVEEPYVEVKTSGYIKTGFIVSDIKDGPAGPGFDKSRDFDVEGGVNVKGSVQSALGEVGVTVQAKWDINESGDNAAGFALRDEGLIGFWQFADTMKLEAGRGNAGRLENGIDKNTRRLWTFGNRRVRAENAGANFFDRDRYNAFMGLAYASGPMTLTVRAHDASRGVGGTGNSSLDDDALGVSAKGTFTGEMISLEMSGGYWGQDDARTLALPLQVGVKWLAGVGTELNIIDGIPISIGAQMGRLHNGTKSTKVSTSIGFTLTEDITAGIGAGWTRISNVPVGSLTEINHTEKVLHGEIYYAPMSYLIVGLEADYYKDGKPTVGPNAALSNNDGFTAAVVSRYSF